MDLTRQQTLCIIILKKVLKTHLCFETNYLKGRFTMKTLRNLFIIFMVMVMMLTTVLTSCSDPADDSNDTTPADNIGNQGDTTTPAEGDNGNSSVETEYDPLAQLAIEDFGQYVFNIITPSRTWAITNMTATDLTADTIQDAIYERQVAIEERLSIKLEEIISTDDITTKLMSTAMQSGEDSYDLALVQTYNALKMYNQNYVYDQTELDSIDLTNPWWEQSFNQDVNIGDKRYISFGNANLIYYSSFYIFCFNKSMIEDHGMESPYDLVANGKWTYDKVYEMMQTAAVDNGADGIYTPGEDTLGLTGHINHSRNLILSSGTSITTRDNDGFPVYNGLSDKFISAFTKFTEFFINSPYCAIAGKSPSPYTGYSSTGGVANYIQVFIDGQSLFLTTGTNEVTTLRNTETEYGIVVVPKYEEAQENYITPVYSATEGFVIPMNAPDPERTALILETLGALSYNNLVDKHIGTVLHYKVANDPTAIENINMAYASGAIDNAMANNFGTCTNILNNLNVYGSVNVASTFKAIEKKLISDIEDAVTNLG